MFFWWHNPTDSTEIQGRGEVLFLNTKFDSLGFAQSVNLIEFSNIRFTGNGQWIQNAEWKGTTPPNLGTPRKRWRRQRGVCKLKLLVWYSLDVWSEGGGNLVDFKLLLSLGASGKPSSQKQSHISSKNRDILRLSGCWMGENTLLLKINCLPCPTPKFHWKSWPMLHWKLIWYDRRFKWWNRSFMKILYSPPPLHNI